MPSPFPSTRAKAQPPQPRESNHALYPNTGPGAEGGGGDRRWPRRSRGTLREAAAGRSTYN